VTALVRWLGRHPTRRASWNCLIWSLTVLLAVGAGWPTEQRHEQGGTAAASTSSPTPHATQVPRRISTAPSTPGARGSATRSVERSAAAAAPGVRLWVTDQKDGDSWVASDGNEYRLGLVNPPEYNEPCGSEATAFTRAFLRRGFVAHAYAMDAYGRDVSEIFDPRGRSLNVALAANGLGNDKYLARYRHENPDLAARVDAAFATTPRPACLGGAAGTAHPAPATVLSTGTAPAGSATCHRDYLTCIPIKGTGSGSGDANDLDCADIQTQVRIRNTHDPYRLDSDGDGDGCESYG
jgi:endonuclease YncB( thermonuclease family)